MDRLFEKVKAGVEELVGANQDQDQDQDQDQGQGQDVAYESAADAGNRYSSFAPQTSGHVKWHVDGASYFWAVSMALEEARDSIYILDWWLSPELYLRRPPARNERYRLDKMLLDAAERGVQVNIIVYKEVPQALTLDSKHTKHALEDLHPNIRVFRHPNHIPSGNEVKLDIESGFKSLSMRTFDLATLSKGALKALYGTSDDMVLYWAHHEKLCIIDNRIAFMGGLDMCFGRWDTNSHPIADAHPDDLNGTIYPGQDYNNARIYDFEDVDKWEHNKLDRTKSSRMGWSDISISLTGPVVNSLLVHFTDRWNYIYNQKYRGEDKYQSIPATAAHAPPAPGMLSQGSQFFAGLHSYFHQGIRRMMPEEDTYGDEAPQGSGAHIQLTRSACPWSSGHPTEHSVQNAYVEAITNARHFVYIENQFFITATCDEQHPVANKIGRAIVDRIVRAHQAGEEFQIVVVMPAVPAFAGDLKSKDALGTRAIMEFQYNSINRGGHSIMETLQQEGVDDPQQYINFYNLRNYDRINSSGALTDAERDSGVSYDTASRQLGNDLERGEDGQVPYDEYAQDDSQYQRYQDAASRLGSDPTWDSVAACYMESGPDLRGLPWAGTPESELDAFVSEELYIHSKVLIADDHLVICGSANLNDRSQLGDHDSEIAVVIEDPTPVSSTMAGAPYTASAFAASLRRQLFRKHLGLLPHQAPDRPDGNWSPASHDPANAYDWGSAADALVADPLDARFLELWRGTARRNTEVFDRAFHPVPSDAVRNWDDYDAFFSRHFVMPGAKEEDKEEGRVDYGHVVKEEFPGGVEELKEWLGQVRGTLVEMPLKFLAEVEELAKQGLEVNELTDEIYT